MAHQEMFWFHDSPDKTFKTIRELLHAFLKEFGRSQQEVHDELVDIFMKTWKYKNLSYMETISSVSELDIPSNPIEDFNESVQNMQFAHDEPYENMNEQFIIEEDDSTETYVEYSDPHGLQLDSKKDEEVCVEIADECIDEPVIYFEECLVERKKDNGAWLVPPCEKFQVDQTWEGVFCESSWTRIIQTLVASFHPFHGWL